MSYSPELDARALRLIAHKRCAVGVSGGSDSLALLLLLKEQSSADLFAVSVDHGLREEATAEAEYVGEICQEFDIEHRVLRVEVPHEGNLQAEARRQRYRALNAFCNEEQIGHLAVGHNWDDQVETYFLNSFRGSGVDGLAAMPVIKSGQPVLLRPALYLRREEMRDYLREAHQSWVDDPSNDNPKFDRVRMRQWLKEAENYGFSFENIGRTTENMARLRDYLAYELRETARRVIHFSPLFVEAQIGRQEFVDLHEEMKLRLLARLCQFYGGSPYKPRLSSLENLALSLENREGGLTLEKTDFHWQDGLVRICAEPAFLPEMSARQWGRFRYESGADSALKIGPLGDHIRAFDAWREWGISKRAAESLPVLFRGGAPVAAPWDQIECESFWDFGSAD